MNFQEKLEKAIEKYNQLVEEEHKLEQDLLKARDERTAQLGRLDTLKQLYDESLAEASLNASSNGKGDKALNEKVVERAP